MFERFDEHVRRSLFFARYEASRVKSRSIASEHLLLGVLREADRSTVQLFGSLDINLRELRGELLQGEVSTTQIDPSPELPLADETKRILAFAVNESENMGHLSVGTHHLVLGMLRAEDTAAENTLASHGFDLFQIREELMQHGEKDIESDSGPDPTPLISEFARDLTALAEDGSFDPLIGRENELERLVQTLSRRTKNNPLLLGDAGVGTTAIVEGLAQRIVDGPIPSFLEDRRILGLDLSLLVAGTKYRGQFEERLKGLLKELREHPEVIVFIDEIHSLIGTGSAEGSLDAANILKPALSRGEINCIGATTVREYRKYVEKDRALSRRFQPVDIRQPNDEECVAILRGIQSRYEEFHGITYSDEAITSAVALAARYITDRSFPDKAIDVIDEAGARVKLRQANQATSMRSVQKEIRIVVRRMKDAISKKEFDTAVSLREQEIKLREELEQQNKSCPPKSATQPIVNRNDIEDVVASWTGIPVTSIKEDEAERLRRMEEILGQRIVGQDNALCAVARAIRRSRLGVTSPHRPIGSFIFLGPSGVGKTEVARQLARYLFQDSRRLLRFDMSEYMEKHTVSRLIGSPPGYVGYEEGGQLSEQVRRNPYAVILLDEIEKAHQDIYNLLLQVLEDGRLTDNYGNVVDFTNTLIIMTSNLGSRDLVQEDTVGFGSQTQKMEPARMREIVDRSMRRHFPPEFYNRVDDVIVFEPLNETKMLEVAELLLQETADLLALQDIHVKHGPEVALWLVHRCGIDQQAGARPLRRLIQTWIEDRVADHLIKDHRKRGANLSIIIANDNPVVVVNDPVSQERLDL